MQFILAIFLNICIFYSKSIMAYEVDLLNHPYYAKVQIAYKEGVTEVLINKKVIIKSGGTVHFHSMFQLDDQIAIFIEESNGQNGRNACGPWHTLLILKSESEFKKYRTDGACVDIFSVSKLDIGPSYKLIIKYQKSLNTWEYDGKELKKIEEDRTRHSLSFPRKE
ncbi:hypothetical protein DU000_08330 [Parvibium lacunae]|uniref:Uncharacterized protein n=2 Tax=Parvibium lacunae TaxID=1888893 RepID=A0A368L1L4_9BURK|nr:hypothetical protein DU000_08330 [Parvibium lacunae]